VSALQEIGVVAWLDQGSLLGIVRDGRFLPWDGDIDLGVWYHDIAKLEGCLLTKLAEKGKEIPRFRVERSRQGIKIQPVPRGACLVVDLIYYRQCGNKAVTSYYSPVPSVSLLN